MNGDERYVLVYTNGDGDGDIHSLRLWALDDARRWATVLNENPDQPGRWTVHQLSDEVQL